MTQPRWITAHFAMAPIRINCGGWAAAPDWVADTGFSGGTAYSTTQPISGMPAGVPLDVYQTERCGAAVSYSLPNIPDGVYTVRLHFAELEDKQPGQRVFDMRLQGRLVAPSLDIVREAGGPRRLLTKTFQVTPDQELVLEFLPQAGTPLLNGLELFRDPAAATQ